MEDDNKINTCYAYNVADTFKFDTLQKHLGNRYRLTTHKDVIRIERQAGDAFVFQYGVIVSWGLPFDDLQALLAETRTFLEGEHTPPLVDEFTFSIGHAAYRIHEDHILLKSDDPLERIAVAHGIAQSLKLGKLERSAQASIEDTAHIPKRIATRGDSHLSRRELSRIRGNLFLVKSEINLQFDLLDTPDFFWDYPEYQDIYDATSNYLEVKQRIDILNKKLGVIQELFNMLSDEQKHKHSSKLEWIIIWLIAIEIVFFLVHDIFKII